MKTITTILATIFTLTFSVVNAQNDNSVSMKGEIKIEKNANGAVITWSTAAETNTSHFEIEISYDNNSFNSIRVVAASEMTKWATNYEAKFKRTYISAEKVYYRVKTVFIDGTETYTNAAALEVKNGNNVSYASIH